MMTDKLSNHLNREVNHFFEMPVLFQFPRTTSQMFLCSKPSGEIFPLVQEKYNHTVIKKLEDSLKITGFVQIPSQMNP